MTTTPDLATLAAKLTKAQKAALTKGHGFSRRTLHNLQIAKLIAGWSFDGSANVGWILEWTPLGLALRQHLMENRS